MVSRDDLPEEIKKLKEKIMAVCGPSGEKWDNLVYTINELYGQPGGEPADLVVYWDNLSWRSAGTVGHRSIYLPENDTGPDDGVHDWDGIFLAWRRKGIFNIDTANMQIKDVFDAAMSSLEQD